jgi:hypothetical protein
MNALAKMPVGTEPCRYCDGQITVTRDSPFSMTIVHSLPICEQFDRFTRELLCQRYPWPAFRSPGEI